MRAHRCLWINRTKAGQRSWSFPAPEAAPAGAKARIACHLLARAYTVSGAMGPRSCEIRSLATRCNNDGTSSSQPPCSFELRISMYLIAALVKEVGLTGIRVTGGRWEAFAIACYESRVRTLNYQLPKLPTAKSVRKVWRLHTCDMDVRIQWGGSSDPLARQVQPLDQGSTPYPTLGEQQAAIIQSQICTSFLV